MSRVGVGETTATAIVAVGGMDVAVGTGGVTGGRLAATVLVGARDVMVGDGLGEGSGASAVRVANAAFCTATSVPTRSGVGPAGSEPEQPPSSRTTSIKTPEMRFLEDLENNSMNRCRNIAIIPLHLTLPTFLL